MRSPLRSQVPQSVSPADDRLIFPQKVTRGFSPRKNRVINSNHVNGDRGDRGTRIPHTDGIVHVTRAEHQRFPSLDRARKLKPTRDDDYAACTRETRLLTAQAISKVERYATRGAIMGPARLIANSVNKTTRDRVLLVLTS